ncbi:hypothetical protein B296_00049562 [Ensete ventricosum]|uniref:Uncharacterized protein n=1 Tax=Ensete ventricosum TaxID=4639 RepID=A0A426XXU5_ENSVE|nr:hypothetical protein B296_00049562 [Ensete ventricosum]
MGAKLVEEGSSGVRRAVGPYEEEEAEGDGSGCCGWKGGAGYSRCYTSPLVLLAIEEIRLPSILVVGPTGEEAEDTSSLHQEKRMRERSPWQEERTRKMVTGGSKGQREKRCGHRFDVDWQQERTYCTLSVKHREMISDGPLQVLSANRQSSRGCRRDGVCE